MVNLTCGYLNNRYLAVAVKGKEGRNSPMPHICICRKYDEVAKIMKVLTVRVNLDANQRF
jgi:hypothetical protein